MNGMDDEEAAAIVEEELQRRDRDETLRNAKKILRGTYGQRLKEAAEAITKADEDLEAADAAIKRQHARGVAPTNESIVELRVAKARLAEAEQAYARVKDAEPDALPPTTPGHGLLCQIDATPFDGQGHCVVCGRPASQVGQSLPGHTTSRLMDAMKRG